MCGEVWHVFGVTPLFLHPHGGSRGKQGLLGLTLCQEPYLKVCDPLWLHTLLLNPAYPDFWALGTFF